MVFTKNSILSSKNSFYHLYHIIFQYFQHPSFYFPILLIKIIYLPNKIIYSKTMSILSHLSPLSNFYLSSTETKLDRNHRPKTTYRNPNNTNPNKTHGKPTAQRWSSHHTQTPITHADPNPNKTHSKPKQNPRQTHSPMPISTPHPNTDFYAKRWSPRHHINLQRERKEK